MNANKYIVGYLCPECGRELRPHQRCPECGRKARREFEPVGKSKPRMGLFKTTKGEK
jgi:uncharacterized OB-fold protein